MSRKKQSRGTCTFCEREISKSGITKHFSSCEKRQEIIAAADQKSGKEGIFYHLQVQDAWQGDYWLHLEMDGKASLEVLDNYLRAIWLECCGHLSEFSFGKWTGQTISMSKKAGQVFSPGLEIDHIYDFGTSSETVIKVLNIRKGKAIKPRPIALLARNIPPEITCIECDKAASWLCLECQYDYDLAGTLCDDHAKVHPHDNYGEPMRLFNSPRVGMCGYNGPAEAPY